MRHPSLPSLILRKSEYFDLWHRGLLGNKLRSWRTPAEIPSSYQGGVMVRDSVPGWGSAKVFPRREVIPEVRRREAAGRRSHLNEAAPDTHAVLQGELLRDSRGLYLFGYERPPARFGELMRMRDVLPLASHYLGLQASLLLRKYLNPPAFDDLMELLDLFEDHVVEFSAYTRHIGGAFPSRNLIVWEVRRY